MALPVVAEGTLDLHLYLHALPWQCVFLSIKRLTEVEIIHFFTRHVTCLPLTALLLELKLLVLRWTQASVRQRHKHRWMQCASVLLVLTLEAHEHVMVPLPHPLVGFLLVHYERVAAGLFTRLLLRVGLPSVNL